MPRDGVSSRGAFFRKQDRQGICSQAQGHPQRCANGYGGLRIGEYASHEQEGGGNGGAIESQGHAAPRLLGQSLAACPDRREEGGGGLGGLLGGSAKHGQFARCAISVEERQSPLGGNRLLHVQSHTGVSHKESTGHVSGGMGQVEVEPDGGAVLLDAVRSAVPVAAQDQISGVHSRRFQ